MKILFLSKQAYMRLDVLNDRYGRLYQIPARLAAEGTEVNAILALYRLSYGVRTIKSDSVRWTSYTLPTHLGAYLHTVKMSARDADAIVASSDCFHIALGGWAKRWSGKPLVADLYDNYESFGMAKLPFIKAQYLRGLRTADLICCNGKQLTTYANQCAPKVETLVLRSTIEKGAFAPRSKQSCRATFGLAPDRKLVGVAGGLTVKRGIGFVYEACRLLNEEGLALDLVLAGGNDPGWPIPSDPWVKFLGDMPHTAMVDFYNAMDLNVIQVQNDDFGHYCFPQKAEEILATGAPMIAANVGEIADVLQDFPEILFKPDSVEQIQTAIRSQLLTPTRVTVNSETWHDSIHRLHTRLNQLVR